MLKNLEIGFKQPSGFISIPPSIYKTNKPLFGSTAESNGMINAGIQKGDTLIFEYTNQLSDGDIGCFRINKDTMCKRFFYNENRGLYILQFEDGKQAPYLIEDSNKDFQILGKLALIIKKK